MTLIKKLAAILTAGALAVSLAACGGSGKTATPTDSNLPMGRYIEQEWAMPFEDVVNVSGLHKREDGRFAMLLNSMDWETGQRYFSTSDGVDWLEESPQWLTDLKEQECRVQDISYAKDGTAALYCSGNNADGMYESFICLVAPDGTLTRTPIGKADKPSINDRIIGLGTGTEDDDQDSGSEGDVPQTAPAEPAPGDEDSAAAQEGGDGEESGEEGDNPFGDYDPDAFYARNAYIGDDGLVYADTYDKVYAYDPQTGRIIRSLPAGRREFLLLADQMVQVMGPGYYTEEEFEENTLVFYNLSDGKESRRLPSDNLVGYGGDVLGGGEDGSLYLCNEKGIFHLAPGSDTWQEIADGALTLLSLPNTSPIALFSHGEAEYLLLIHDENPKLINYVYDPETPTRPSTELTIYALREFPTIKQAVGAFRQKYPDVLVNYSVVLDGSSASGDDMIKVWNTELLAGKGPDLMVMDDRDDIIKSYAEKGVLADLSGVLGELMESGTVYENIVKAYEQDGKIYAVPARFSLPTLWGEPEAVAASGSLPGLAAYAKANPQKRLFYAMTPNFLVSSFLPAYQSGWYQANGQLDEAAIARFLTEIKDLSETVDKQWLSEEEAFAPRYSDGLQMMSDFESLYEFSANNTAGLVHFTYGFQGIMEPNGSLYAKYGGKVDYDEETQSATSSVPDDQFKGMYRPLSGEQENVFLPSTIVGVNDASTQKELAMEFVRTLLEESVQSTDLQDGFPVNKKAVQRNVEKKEDMMWSWGWSDEFGNVKYLEMAWPSKGVLQTVADSFETLKTPVMLDESMQNAIEEYAADFFAGQGSAEDAAHKIAESMKLQLSE